MSLTEAVELDAGGGNGVDGGCMQALVVIPYAIVPEVIDQPGIGKKEKERNGQVPRVASLDSWTVAIPSGRRPGGGGSRGEPIILHKDDVGLGGARGCKCGSGDGENECHWTKFPNE